MVGVLNLLEPYQQSFAYDQLEQDIQSLFIDVFNELYGEIVEDLYFYGMPHLGSAKVVERFTKQDGLAVLRRPDSSDKLMRIIYATWRSLGSKRGLAFLEFVLQMLWADKWEIKRLYHSIEKANLYPTVATVEPIEASFLTSRIMISMDSSVNFAEVSELASTLFRLVPANIVAQISSEQPLGDFDQFGVGMVMIPFMTANFFSYDPITSENAPAMTNWILLTNISITANAEAIYHAYKTNMISMYKSTATANLSGYILDKLSDQTYRDLQGTIDACLALTQGFIGYKWDVANTRIIANKLPDPPNLVEASRVLINRFYASNNGAFVGGDSFRTAITRVGWVIIDGQIYKVDETPETAYKSADFYSLVSFEDAFNLNLQDQVANNPDLTGATLGEVTIQSQTDTKIEYIQHYTKTEQVAPVPPETEPTTVTTPYELLITVDLVANPAYNPEFDGQPVLLDMPVLETLLDQLKTNATNYNDANMLALFQQSLNYAYSEDITYLYNDLYSANLTYFSFAQIRQQIVDNLNGLKGASFKTSAEDYIRKIANTVFDSNVANQIVKYSDLVPTFNQNQVAV